MQVDRDLRQMLIREDAPKPRKIGVRVWAKAIPQFNVAHNEAVQVATPHETLPSETSVLELAAPLRFPPAFSYSIHP